METTPAAQATTPAPPATPAPPGTTLRADLIAGLTASAVVLPMAMAYAGIAGLPPAVGLYTAVLPMAIYALLGSSRILSVSSTSTLAILAATQLALVSGQSGAAEQVTAAATLTLLIGAILLLAGLLRLGFVANFISLPVLAGFKAGVGAVIVVDQLPRLLGVHIEKTGFLRNLLAIAEQLPQLSPPTLILGASTLVALFLLARHCPRLPAPLLAIGGGIAASWLLDLHARGVATVGWIPQGLPAPTLPDLALARTLLPGALGIALMSFTESIAAARSFAAPDDPPVAPNRELLALGAANLGGALLGAMPAGGGTSQTAVQRAAGGQTQKASWVTAGLAVATLFLLAPLLEKLPYATLAATVTYYAARLIQPAEFMRIRRVRAMEFWWAAVATGGVLLFGTLHGIEVAIIISLIGLASQTAHPPVHVLGRKPGTDILRPRSAEHPEDETFPGLLLLRPEGRLFFVNAPYVAERVRQLVAEHQPRVLNLDLSRVPDLEYSALQMIDQGERRTGGSGVELWLSGLNPGVLEAVRHSGLADRLGHERMLFSAQQAIERYRKPYAAETGAAAPASAPSEAPVGAPLPPV